MFLLKRIKIYILPSDVNRLTLVTKLISLIPSCFYLLHLSFPLPLFRPKAFMLFFLFSRLHLILKCSRVFVAPLKSLYFFFSSSLSQYFSFLFSPVPENGSKSMSLVPCPSARYFGRLYVFMCLCSLVPFYC